ncbi:MAG: hypothetical protein H6739_04625 [Alphaproteobacteria bacterium]|nr:hypothetical protein [Alphaproteobacteria bacterium]
MGKQSPLKSAMQGGDATINHMSERQTRSALGEAVGRIANLTKRAETSKEALLNTGAQVVHTAETQGSLFLSSMAEGFFGEEKLQVGDVDVRAPVGMAAQVYGLYQLMTGGKGGTHALALGNGVTGSWLASVGRRAGQTLREKRNQGQAAVQVQPGVTLLQGQALPQGFAALPQPVPQAGLAGPVREVLLTEPAVQGHPQGGQRPARRPPPGRRPRPQHERRPPRRHDNRFPTGRSYEDDED